MGHFYARNGSQVNLLRAHGGACAPNPNSIIVQFNTSIPCRHYGHKYGKMWFAMVNDGELWLVMVDVGKLWLSVVSYGEYWLELVRYGNLWLILAGDGGDGLLVVNRGNVWLPMVHGGWSDI